MKRLLVAVLLCVACGELPDDESGLDAGAMDAGPVLVDGGADDGGDLVDKQNGSTAEPTYWPTPGVDDRRLPYAIKIRPQDNNGWSTTSSIWLYALCGEGTCPGTAWGRDQNQSWYRAHSLSSTYEYYYQAPAGYICHVAFFGGWCTGSGGTHRIDLSCPTRMHWDPSIAEWRSFYNSGHPNAGWFHGWLIANTKWATNANSIVMDPIGVTLPKPNRVSCVYRPLAPGGWSWVDVWLFKR